MMMVPEPIRPMDLVLDPALAFGIAAPCALRHRRPRIAFCIMSDMASHPAEELPALTVGPATRCEQWRPGTKRSSWARGHARGGASTFTSPTPDRGSFSVTNNRLHRGAYSGDRIALFFRHDLVNFLRCFVADR